jgi:hypothetical protein
MIFKYPGSTQNPWNGHDDVQLLKGKKNKVTWPLAESLNAVHLLTQTVQCYAHLIWLRAGMSLVSDHQILPPTVNGHHSSRSTSTNAKTGSRRGGNRWRMHNPLLLLRRWYMIERQDF